MYIYNKPKYNKKEKELYSAGLTNSDLVGSYPLCIDDKDTGKIVVFIKHEGVRNFAHSNGYFIIRDKTGKKTFIENDISNKGMNIRDLKSEMKKYLREVRRAYIDYIHLPGNSINSVMNSSTSDIQGEN